MYEQEVSYTVGGGVNSTITVENNFELPSNFENTHMPFDPAIPVTG